MGGDTSRSSSEPLVWDARLGVYPIPTIIQDSQEQIPFQFPWPTITHPLRTGDYTICGLEGQLCIERKSALDMVKTLLTRWRAFQRQLSRMMQIASSPDAPGGTGAAIIICEGTLPAVLDHCRSPSQRHRVVQRVAEICCQWRTPVVFAGTYSLANTLAGVVLWQQWQRNQRGGSRR